MEAMHFSFLGLGCFVVVVDVVVIISRSNVGFLGVCLRRPTHGGKGNTGLGVRDGVPTVERAGGHAWRETPT